MKNNFQDILKPYRISLGQELLELELNPFGFTDLELAAELVETLRPEGQVLLVETGNPIELAANVVILRGIAATGYLHNLTYAFVPYTPLIPYSPSGPMEKAHTAREPLQRIGAEVLVLPRLEALSPEAQQAWARLNELEAQRQQDWLVFVRRFPPVARMAIILHHTGPIRGTYLAALADVGEKVAKRFVSAWRYRVPRARQVPLIDVAV